MSENKRTITDQEIYNAFARMDQRMNYCGQNTIQVGLYLEYVIRKLQDLRDPEGNPLVVLDLEGEFLEFAKKRSEEIDNEVAEVRKAMANKKGINLDESAGQ